MSQGLGPPQILSLLEILWGSLVDDHPAVAIEVKGALEDYHFARSIEAIDARLGRIAEHNQPYAGIVSKALLAIHDETHWPAFERAALEMSSK